MNDLLTFVISKFLEAAWLRAFLGQRFPLQREILSPLLIGFVAGTLIVILTGVGLAILAGPLLFSIVTSGIVPPTYPIIPIILK